MVEMFPEYMKGGFQTLTYFSQENNYRSPINSIKGRPIKTNDKQEDIK